MTAYEESGAFATWDEERLAPEISDYVSGRLDPRAARAIERRAQNDGRLAAAIVQAKCVRRRVERRLSSAQPT